MSETDKPVQLTEATEKTTTEKTEVVAAPVTTDASQAKDSVVVDDSAE